MARLTKAERLQKQLDEIRKNCMHPKRMLRKTGNALKGSVPVHCRACVSNLELNLYACCAACLSRSLKQVGDCAEDIVNQCEKTKYKCLECGNEQVYEVET